LDCILILTTIALPVVAQQPGAAERAALLKANLVASRTILRQYQWVETTVVSLKGEEKSRKQEQCYYGADGKVQKIELSASAAPSEVRGPLRRRIAEHKKEELTDYMKEVVALVREYVPPREALIQAAKEAGNVSVQILDPGKRIRLTFSNYAKAGDKLTLDVDLATNRPLAGTVTSTVDSDQSSVTLALEFSNLDTGATYLSHAALTSPSKDLTVAVDNSGYRKASP
jgi:hypothetical protein